jgi:hypothetical protein
LTPRKPQTHKQIAGIDRNELIRFLDSADPGDSLTYFRGFALALGDDAVQALAAEFRQLYLKGVVELVQKRVNGTIEFRAIKRREIVGKYSPWREEGSGARLYAYDRANRRPTP